MSLALWDYWESGDLFGTRFGPITLSKSSSFVRMSAFPVDAHILIYFLTPLPLGDLIFSSMPLDRDYGYNHTEE